MGVAVWVKLLKGIHFHLSNSIRRGKTLSQVSLSKFFEMVPSRQVGEKCAQNS